MLLRNKKSFEGAGISDKEQSWTWTLEHGFDQTQTQNTLKQACIWYFSATNVAALHRALYIQ